MKNEAIVFVHGLWMNGMDMSLLEHRFNKIGYATSRFRYKSRNDTPEVNARKLADHVQSIKSIHPGTDSSLSPSAKVHFVCHSLGGLVIRHLFHGHPGQRPGRVVTLGTPHQPSSAARQLSRSRPGRLLLGQSVEAGLLGPVPPWPGNHDLGVIAGTLRMGFGLLVPGIPVPSDGTVAVSETRLDGMKDHITLPVSHFGLLLSHRVFRQAANFLRYGMFVH